MAALDADQAQQLAKVWYEQHGPYRGSYELQPLAAFRNTDTEWSVRFRVQPDTGFLYFRRFSFARSESSDWEVTDWSADPQNPDEEDFNPDEYDDEDDMETLEQEEHLAQLHRESQVAEIQELEDVRGQWGLTRGFV